MQGLLLEDAVDADIAAIEQALIDLGGPQSAERAVSQPKRQALPPELPRTEVRHEPDSTTCPCGCQLQRIGEDTAEKLDYTLGCSASKDRSAAKRKLRDSATWIKACNSAMLSGGILRDISART